MGQTKENHYKSRIAALVVAYEEAIANHVERTQQLVEEVERLKKENEQLRGEQ